MVLLLTTVLAQLFSQEIIVTFKSIFLFLDLRHILENFSHFLSQVLVLTFQKVSSQCNLIFLHTACITWPFCSNIVLFAPCPIFFIFSFKWYKYLKGTMKKKIKLNGEQNCWYIKGNTAMWLQPTGWNHQKHKRM